MPYLKIQTNQSLDAPTEKAFIIKASASIAQLLGKPESYVMVAIETNRTMLFAGTDEPLAYLELKSIGLSDTVTKDLSANLCTLMTEELAIAQNRIYIEFANADRPMWGWNGGTF